jgi:hypothetical protein
MSDIFKKALADDLKKNFNVKDSEKVLEESAEKAVTQKFQQPATPKTPAPVFKKPVAPAGTPITEKNMDLFFGASEDPKLSQQNIQSAKAVQPKSAIVNKGVTKKDQAIIKDVNKAFTKPETLPIKPLTTPDLKPGEYIYMDPEEEYSNRKALDKSITEGIKTGVNPITKAKIDDKQKKELELVQKQLKLQTEAEQIEAGFIGTGDIATLKRTGGESFQQPMMPLKGFEKIDLSLTKDKDVPKAELLALKLSNEEKFNENFFGKDFAKQEKDKKLNQFVWDKSGPKRGSELIDQYKLEL